MNKRRNKPEPRAAKGAALPKPVVPRSDSLQAERRVAVQIEDMFSDLRRIQSELRSE